MYAANSTNFAPLNEYDSARQTFSCHRTDTTAPESLILPSYSFNSIQPRAGYYPSLKPNHRYEYYSI